MVLIQVRQRAKQVSLCISWMGFLRYSSETVDNHIAPETVTIADASSALSQHEAASLTRTMDMSQCWHSISRPIILSRMKHLRFRQRTHSAQGTKSENWSAWL